MLTVLQAINLSTDYLEKYNVESPRLNAELLLAEILNCKRLELYLLYDKPLNDEEISDYRNYLKRRSNREPLQYILGYTEFYGYKFIVNSSVLIPRPETEILVESVIAKYSDRQKIRILDIGTGSGNICVSLLKNLTNASAVGIDISSETLSVTKKNAELNQVSNRLELKKFDILKDNHSELGKFDLVVSNPPYVSIEDYVNLQPELKVYEPAASLTDYSDGYNFYKKIIPVSKELLTEKGRIIFEIGKGQFNNIKEIFLLHGFSNIQIIKDYNQIERIISGEI